MAFKPLNWEEGRQIQLPCAASVAFVKGGAAVYATGVMNVAAAGEQGDIHYIVMETVTTGAAAGDIVEFYRVDPSVRIEADVDAAAAQTDVGTYCDLATVATLNPDASDDDIFFIESIDLRHGAVGTSTKVTGYFTHGTPNA